MSDKELTMERFKDFSEYEMKLLADAVWMRQRCFIAGDRRFREYGVILDEIRERINYVPGIFA
jgi:hypothetical protein